LDLLVLPVSRLIGWVKTKYAYVRIAEFQDILCGKKK